jgi:hypothetical protein
MPWPKRKHSGIYRLFHSSAASAALYILLVNGGNPCIEEAFIITIHPMVCSDLVSMWRTIDFFEKNDK